MNRYLRMLRDELASQPPTFSDWDVDSMLGFLFYCYTEDQPLENAQVLRCYEKLESFFERLSPEDSDRLFQNISELRAAYELAAFTEGIRIGAALEREIHQHAV